MSRTRSVPEGGHGEDAAVDPVKRRRSRLQLIAIVAVFGVPLLLAVIWLQVVQSGGGGELGDTSRGELIRPAVPLEAFALEGADGETFDAETFRGRWTMLYVPSGACDEDCERSLYHMRQVRLALNHRMTRVQRLVVPSGGAELPGPLLAEHPGLLVAVGDEADRDAFAARVEAARGGLPAIEDAVYLVDPFGNLMMRFGPELPPGEMLKDIKHLLKVSKIG